MTYFGNNPEPRAGWGRPPRAALEISRLWILKAYSEAVLFLLHLKWLSENISEFWMQKDVWVRPYYALGFLSREAAMVGVWGVGGFLVISQGTSCHCCSPCVLLCMYKIEDSGGMVELSIRQAA